MKVAYFVHRFRRTILSSCFLIALVALSSCSQRQPTVQNQPTPTPSPAAAKMEASSGNWKVTVTSVDKIPKQPVDVFESQDQGPENKFDTLQLTVDVEYTGPAGNIQSPATSLVDGNGKKVEALKAAVETPGAIYMASSGPGYTSTKTLFTGDGGSTPDAAAEKAAKEVLYWIDPGNSAYKKKARALKGEEKFSAIYYFQDPKEYANLKFMFEDVPAIPLNAPREEKQTQPETPPAQTPTPPPNAADVKGEGQGKNWKVTVTSIKKIPNDTTNPSEPRDSLEVAVDLEYTGPARMVKAPTASLVDGKGTKYQGYIISTTVTHWVFPEGPPEVLLKAGAKVSVTFSFQDPKEYSNLKLVFNDVPPILLKAPHDEKGSK